MMAAAAASAGGGGRGQSAVEVCRLERQRGQRFSVQSVLHKSRPEFPADPARGGHGSEL